MGSEKQASMAGGEGFEKWWDNWILGQSKPYNALTKENMETCWKAAQREAALATSRAEGPETPPMTGREYTESYFLPCVEFIKRNGYADWDGTADDSVITLTGMANMLARFHMEMHRHSSAEHAPAGPLRRMREAVECVRHEGNDLGECWMDCRRCRLEKELAALAATNAQPATSRAEGPASDALNALVAEKRQLVMDIINTARNGKWNNLVDNAADYALNGFESAVRDAALASQPSAEHAPEVAALSQMKDEEINTSDIPEVTNWSKAEKGKFYRAATPAQLRSALAFERARSDDYERNYILPTFTWAKEYGIDLQKLVMDNAGKNCVELLVRALAAQPAPAPATSAEPLEILQMRERIGTGLHSVNSFYATVCDVLKAEAIRVKEDLWSVSLAGALVDKLWPLIESERAALAAQPAPVRPDEEKGACPECGCEEVHPRTGLWTCECPAPLPRNSNVAEPFRSIVNQFSEPAPAPATSAEPLERCPECGGPIFVRGNGTIVAHYGGGIDPNRCKASETKFVRATLRQPGTPSEPLRHGIDCRKATHTSGKMGYLHDESSNAPYDVDGVMYCGRCHGWIDNPVPGTPAEEKK